MPYPAMLAQGFTAEGTSSPFQLWAGESDIVTGQGTCGATALEQFRVISRVAGLLIPWDGTTLTGAGAPIGVAAQPIAVGATGPYFSGGFFNHQALIWPGGVATLTARKAAFDGSNIEVGQVIGVTTPMTFP